MKSTVTALFLSTCAKYSPKNPYSIYTVTQVFYSISSPVLFYALHTTYHHILSIIRCSVYNCSTALVVGAGPKAKQAIHVLSLQKKTLITDIWTNPTKSCLSYV